MDYRICCFTGHRHIPPDHLERLYGLLDDTILSLYQQGVRVFRTGGAMGVDTVAALRVLYQRSKGLDISLELLLPCKNQTEKWPRAAIVDYEFILRRADTVRYIAEQYHRFCMLDRDRALVDGSSFCVSYLLENRGGTAYTVAYALKNGLTLINLADALRKPL